MNNDALMKPTRLQLREGKILKRFQESKLSSCIRYHSRKFTQTENRMRNITQNSVDFNAERCRIIYIDEI